MNETGHYFSRRTFLKTATAVGAASILGVQGNPAMASQPQAIVPTRPFGKTGIDVPILSFGGSLSTSLSTLLLRQTVKWGVTYWDTANTYMGGKSEICTEMPNMTQLMSNVAAAMNRRKLSAREVHLLRQYARETRSDYCTGCTAICESAVDCGIPIGDVMRYLMYARSYGDRNRGKMHFKKIPLRIRRQLGGVDYRAAEQRCPQKIAIGSLMREALKELG